MWAGRILLVAVLIVGAACQKTAEDWTEEAEIDLKAYRLDDAARMFQRALDRDPFHPPALYGMGWIHHTRQDDVAARVYFERCIEAAPDYYGGYKGMGSVHLAAGFFEQAEASLKKSIALKPDEAATWASLGYVYLLTRRLDRAEEVFRKALEIEPDRGEVYYMLAELRARQGAYEAALEELRLAEKKRIDEDKFRLLNCKLRGQLLLRMALVDLPAGTISGLPEASLKKRLELLELAEKAFDEALGLSFSEETTRINRLKRKVLQARQRLSGPSPI